MLGEYTLDTFCRKNIGERQAVPREKRGNDSLKPAVVNTPTGCYPAHEKPSLAEIASKPRRAIKIIAKDGSKIKSTPSLPVDYRITPARVKVKYAPITKS